MKCLFAFLLLSALVLPAIAFAETDDLVRTCKTNPSVVAPCFSIRGRISAYNGAPSLRIWQIGTSRILGIISVENEIIPEILKGKVSFNQSVFANLEVCPFTKSRLGEMQIVCVESATDIQVRSTITYRKR